MLFTPNKNRILKPPIPVHIDLDADMANGSVTIKLAAGSMDIFTLASLLLHAADQCLMEAAQIAQQIPTEKGRDNGEQESNHNPSGN
jgi:hypothetical protein